MIPSRSAEVLSPHKAAISAPPSQSLACLLQGYEEKLLQHWLHCVFLLIYLNFGGWGGGGDITLTFKCLTQYSLEQDQAGCSLPLRVMADCTLPSFTSPHPKWPPPALHLPYTVEASHYPLVFVYFCCNLMIIRFLVPQIREYESNSGSCWVQRGTCLYMHF